jgi:hypothetical protein
MSLVTDRKDLDTSIDPLTGQQKTYLVLSEEERAKGFVRPVRHSYKHVGKRPKHELRDLTESELRYNEGQPPEQHFVKFEMYPEGSPERARKATGRFWTQAELNSGCGAVTTMGQALAETYARDPSFYGGTFCCRCGTHLPVGEHGEFVWEPDGSRVGT